MAEYSELRLYATQPHDCSYLPDQKATMVFIDPEAPIDGKLFSRLSAVGFRRSGKSVYKPHCEHCHACIPIRIPSNRFKPSRSQKRCLSKNADLVHQEVTDIASDEHFELYQRYISTRHQDGDMYPPSREQYENFLTTEWDITRFIEFRDTTEKLMMVSVIDELEDGLSAIYAFFEPNTPKRSLGAFNILFQIQRSIDLALPYVYLGYWIRNCQKMQYKSHYKPFELLIDRRWMLVKENP